MLGPAPSSQSAAMQNQLQVLDAQRALLLQVRPIWFWAACLHRLAAASPALPAAGQSYVHECS